jgi:hypothetical protein
MKKFFHEKLEEAYLRETNISREQLYKYFLDKHPITGDTLLSKDITENHQYSMLYALYSLSRNQNKIFVVGNELAAALCNTDIKVKMSDILPPFRSFIIYIENSDFTSRFTKDNGYEDVIVRYIFVELFRESFRVNSLNEEMLCLRFLIGYCAGDDNNIDDWYNGPLTQIPTAYKEEWDLSYDENNMLILGGQEESASNKYFADFQESPRKAANFILSLILYCNAKNRDIEIIRLDDGFTRLADIKNPKKRRRLEKTLQDKTRYLVYYIGRGYKIRHEDEVGAGAGKLDHRVLVRGHWRRQWHGKKIDKDGLAVPGEYQKLVWIEPYYKGLEFNEENRKTVYRVIDEPG